jgi:WD40 repeat protein
MEPASLRPTEPDIFNDQQEQWLGEAFAEEIESQMRFAPAAENVYLQAMGEKMLALLPPTGMHFQFRIYESGELNAFGLPGGRVYVSRKVVAALKNEDELAGLLAHEMGHILAHQQAIEITALMREWLGVTHVGDRADVFANVHALDQASGKKLHWHAPSEEHNQDVADQVAIYAMMRAGYQPKAYADAFDRITANNGKMGNGLLDFFGTTTEEQRRYRADMKMAALIPEHCMGEAKRDPEAFAAWKKLLAERTTKQEETNAATRVIALKEPLRSDLRTIRYSPDGKYVLAQDSAKVFVLQRQPLKVLFTIDAEHTMLPHFTPDSHEVVFLTNDLRVERWDVATGKRTYVKELILPKGCDLQELSPDGKVLACERIYEDKGKWPAAALELWSVEDNAILFEKPAFVKSNDIGTARELALAKDLNYDPGTFEFSPDSRWFVAGLLGSHLVYDLGANKKGGGEHGIDQLRGKDFAFVGNDKVVTVESMQGHILSFPQGQTLKTLAIGWQEIYSVTKGDYVVLRPIKDYAAGLMDLNADKLIQASKYGAMDVYGDEMATQTPRGGVQFNSLRPGQPVESIELPESRLGGLTDAEVTQDAKYLVVSTPQRSAIWNLETGNRLGVMRPYSRVAALPGDVMYFDFTKFEDKPRVQGTVDLKKGTSSEATLKLPEKHSELVGDMYVVSKPDDPSKPGKNSTYDFYDLTTGKLAWSRHFTHAVPTIYRDFSRDRVGMWWEMSDAGGQQEINSDPVLKQAMEASGKERDGMVLQMLDARTGAVLQTIAVKEHKPKNERDVRELLAFGDFLLVQGEAGNTVIYRLSDKSRIGEVYGSAIAADVTSGMLAMSNRRNEVFLLDAATSKELARYTLGADVRLAHFVPGKAQLLVLTAEQKVYTFDVGSAAGQQGGRVTAASH